MNNSFHYLGGHLLLAFYIKDNHMNVFVKTKKCIIFKTNLQVCIHIKKLHIYSITSYCLYIIYYTVRMYTTFLMKVYDFYLTEDSLY